MKKKLLCILLLLTYQYLPAQLNRYIVIFKHKGGGIATLATPNTYLSDRAQARRTRYNIGIDSTDLPVPRNFIIALHAIPNVEVLNVSKWLNAAVVRTTDPAALNAINALPFVQNSAGIGSREGVTPGKFNETIVAEPLLSRGNGIEENYFDYGNNSFAEIHLHNGEFLHNIGLRGETMQIAMLDGGFFNYTSLRAFDSANLNGQFLSTWDFVAGNNSVVEDNSHGMQCLSTILANIPGQFIGKAPKASFHLYRTEDVATEYPVEEFHWACAAERADSSGSDIISSSLGYGYEFSGGIPDYPYSTLNGDITMSARAADLAAQKGLLVFNSAGNSGNDYWRMITTPADGDSVVAVGAVNKDGIVGAFSSYGPSADGRVKPDVASVGVAAMIQATNNSIAFGNGTSYACPNMAGLATCLWQAFPEVNNMRIVRALKESASRFNNPDTRMGYGIPDMKTAFSAILKERAVVTESASGCDRNVQWTSKDVNGMRYVVEVQNAGSPSFIPLQTLSGTGGSTLTTQTYNYTISNTQALEGTTVAIRIRQVIDTVAASYSDLFLDTIYASFGTNCNGNVSTDDLLLVAPNPVSDQSGLIIQSSAAIANMTVLVFDMKGSLVQRITASKQSGRTVVPLETAKLAPGEYLVKVYDKDKSVGKTRFVKL